MKIVVLVKEVPDTYGERELNIETGLADRDVGDSVLDEIGERAVEVAVQYAQAHPGTEVVAVSVTPPKAITSVRRALALGADSAVHIVDELLVGADLTLTAEALAAAVRKVGFDLVIAGNLSTDGTGGVIPAMVAELLDVALASALERVDITADTVTGTRTTDGGIQQVEVALPCVVSITDALPDPRVPSFKGIIAAKKKPVETLGLGDLAIISDVTLAPRSIMVAITERPARAAGLKIVDEGTAGEQLADFLVQNRLVSEA